MSRGLGAGRTAPSRDEKAMVEESEELSAGGRWARIELSGEIDIVTAPAYHDSVIEVLAARPGGIVIDVSRVTFMDSSGLGVLARVVRGSRDLECDVYLLDPQDTVRQVIKVCGLDHFLIILDDDDPRYAGVIDASTGSGQA